MTTVVDSAHLALVELEGDIACNLRTSELNKRPNVTLLSSQPQISWEMRPQLLEFLAQAQAALELLPETFALAVNILDRYMSRRIVYARHYQLLGCICLWLAAKTIDDKHSVPTTSTLAYFCADTYNRVMFAEMELHVLSTLDWNILAPTALDFVDLSVGEVARNLGGDMFCSEDYSLVCSMARYACECALFAKETVAIKPSTIAASSVALATIVVDVIKARGWVPVYPEGCSKECFDALVAVIANPPSECAARYAGDDQNSASSFFAQFFAALSTSPSPYGAQCAPSPWHRGDMQYSNIEEPCTPMRSRQVSFDSFSTMSPADDELTSPEDSERSPYTYFVPLTPEGLYCYSGRATVDLPQQRQQK